MATLRDQAETSGGRWPSIHLLWLRPCGDNGPISKWGSFMAIEDIQVLLLPARGRGHNRKCLVGTPWSRCSAFARDVSCMRNMIADLSLASYSR